MMGSMDDNSWLRLAVSLGLVLGNGFFVASEYALVSSRKSRIDALVKRGSKSAMRVQYALSHLSEYVAGIQIAITMFSIGVGSVTEPFVTELLQRAMGSRVDRGVSFTLSLILVTYLMVVIGELVPKYLALDRAERVALFTIRPLHGLVTVLKPLIWVIEKSGVGASRLFGVRAGHDPDAVSKEELLLMVKSGGSSGLIDKLHADMVSKTMQLDKLAARDIMIHRLDIHWLDAALTKTEALKAMGDINHTRIPVCRGDIDEVVGVAYVNDILKHLEDSKFSLEKLARPAVVVPENLTIDRIVQRMREDKTQILMVVDEYGGTAGLITLEDVVEEIFGELEDSLESERPPIEVHAAGRVTAKADVRFDELVDRLGIELDDDPATDTLATMLINELERMPKIGDTIDTALGRMRVDNMARRRIVRVSLSLSPEIQEKVKPSP
jgi:putative hemolysin